MRSIVTFAAFGVLAWGTAALARDVGSMDPTGTWLVEDSKAKIHLEKCGADNMELCGEVVWLKDPLDDNGKPKTDVKNPDPAKRNRAAVGMRLINELKPDDNQVYVGQIYNAENGKLYDVTLKMDKPAELHLRGCVLSILCQSQTWTRVADLPPAVVATTQKLKAKQAAPAQ